MISDCELLFFFVVTYFPFSLTPLSRMPIVCSWSVFVCFFFAFLVSVLHYGIPFSVPFSSYIPYPPVHNIYPIDFFDLNLSEGYLAGLKALSRIWFPLTWSEPSFWQFHRQCPYNLRVSAPNIPCFVVIETRNNRHCDPSALNAVGQPLSLEMQVFQK